MKYWFACSFTLISCLALLGLPTQAVGQTDRLFTGNGDNNLVSNPANFDGVNVPAAGDSISFGGPDQTIDYDLPASVVLGLGGGATGTDGGLHFLADSGEFTFEGPENIVIEAQSVIRFDDGAGETQTFNTQLVLQGGGSANQFLQFSGNTGGSGERVIFNAGIDFTNDNLIIDSPEGDDGPPVLPVVEINAEGFGVGDTRGFAGAGLISGVGDNVVFFNRTLASNTVATIQIDSTVSNPLGATTSFNDTNGDGDDDQIILRGFGGNGISSITSNGDLDLSGYAFYIEGGSGGGSVRVDSAFDTTVGYLTRLGNFNRVFSNQGTGTVTISEAFFVSPDAVARTFGVQATGGDIVFDGTLNTTALNFGQTGNQITSSEVAEFGDGEGTVNGSIDFRNGNVFLNADSSATFIGGQIEVLNDGVLFIGSDGALGDSTTLFAVRASGATLDTGTFTIDQEFQEAGGLIRGNGRLTNINTESITGTLQPGGELPTAADILTLDFSAELVSHTLTLDDATLDLVLDTGLANSSIDVLGSTGGTILDIIGGTVNLTDLSGGSLTAGDYVLVNGDENTTFTFDAEAGSVDDIEITGLTGFDASTLSVVGSDLVLSLVSVGDALDGDFNDDGVVNAADYVIARDGGGPTGDIAADVQLAIDNFGATAGGPVLAVTAAVPEPTTLLLFALGWLALVGRQARRV